MHKGNFPRGSYFAYDATSLSATTASTEVASRLPDPILPKARARYSVHQPTARQLCQSAVGCVPWSGPFQSIH